MACGKYDAARMFWSTPELVEQLLPFLDAGSTNQLAEAHQLTLQILGKALTCHKLTKRTFPVEKNLHLDQDVTLLASEKAKARTLAGILSMIPSSQRPELEVGLLHAICNRFPAKANQHLVDVSCSCFDTHHVSTGTFLILEEVEACLNSKEQTVLNFGASSLALEEPLLSALGSRLLRQQEKVKKAECDRVWILNKESAETWANPNFCCCLGLEHFHL